ncbi:hypothetical protein HOT99_gp067 [Caulobacter phage CcrBL10]|uniref:Uncharacterized protein n=1 Tax=Caulobacter phage CcrBL10 TaxID=2283269 RepID=A0A385E8V4_9CAUD|nr:hypothetical protein HOT99_gp067 [Caulobacter phage CcrBL10]AXQ68271.1 hypothetical protein CcrBL10_gp067 [Caulobacter phage CcrBL10]
MSNKNLVEVFSPEGKRELHTRLNANDLVNGAGWTWKKNASPDFTPAAHAPYRSTAKNGPEPAQAVLDMAGHRNDRTIEEVTGGDEADAEVEAEVEDEVVEPAAEEAPAPAAPARGRGRKAGA